MKAKSEKTKSKKMNKRSKNETTKKNLKATDKKTSSKKSLKAERLSMSEGADLKTVKTRYRVSKWYDDLVGKVTRALGDSKKLNSVINNLNKSRETALKAF